MKINLLFLMFMSLLFLFACQNNKREAVKYKPQNLQTPSKADTKIVKRQYDIPIKSSQNKLEITNLYGDIYIRKTSEPYVGILSTTQVFEKEGEIAQYILTQNESEVSISFEYNAKSLKTYEKANKLIGRVDLVVFIPKKLKVQLTTNKGTINIKELSNDFILTSQSGTIKFSGIGKVNISTQSGNVYCNLNNPKWQGLSSIESDLGNIFLTFSDLETMDIVAQSGEAIHANFPAKVASSKNQMKFTNKSLINSIKLLSKAGFIKLVSIAQYQQNPTQKKSL